jgi:hypothetical protein
MHMLMPMGMHMHPMLRIRFERRAPIPAPAGRGSIEAKRTEAGIGAGTWRNRLFWIQKKPGVLRRQASRFLAPCFTWRQEAANHHDIDCARQSRGHSGRRQGPRSNCRFGGQLCHRYMVCASVTPPTFCKVVSRVPGALFQRFGDRSCESRGAAPASSRPAPATNTFRPSPSSPFSPLPTARFTTLLHSDLTVTTRPGFGAFSRSPFPRFGSASSPAESTAPFMAPDFNPEAHTL